MPPRVLHECEPARHDCRPRINNVGLDADNVGQTHTLESMIMGSYANGIKLVVTYYHIKGYGNSCRVHSRAVWTGACSIPCCHASVHDSDQLPQLLVRDS
jgi:hypothetical protein